MSTDAQLKGHSLERQLDLAKAYAAQQGFTLVDDIRDIGLSAHDGSHVEKGKFGQFLTALETGKIGKGTVLLVENLDRLSRQSPLQALQQLIGLVEYGIEIHTIFDGQVYTRESLNSNPGQLFMSVGYMVKAHSESEDKSKRLKRRWKSNRDKVRERNLTSICPAWLRPNGSKVGFTLIPDRAEIISKIFDMCIDEGMGAFSIASFLNQNSYPPFTDPARRRTSTLQRTKVAWHKSYILKILNNPAVYGELALHEMVGGKRQATGEVIEDYFPVVVSKDRYLLAQARLHQRKVQGGGRKGNGFQNIFTKLVACGDCGGTVNFYDKGPGPKGGTYLRCGRASARQGCECRAWRYEQFEEAFFSYVSGVNFEGALQRGNDKSRKDLLSQEREVVEERIRTFRSTIDSLLDLQAGMSAAALKPVREKIEKIIGELKELEGRRNEIDIEVADLNRRGTSEMYGDIVSAIKKAQENAPDTEKVFIRRLIHGQITAVISQITLDGLLPGADEETRSFTAIFKNGQEQTVFPYGQEEEEFAELRSLDGESPPVKVGTSSFKFLGRLDRLAISDLGEKKQKKRKKKIA